MLSIGDLSRRTGVKVPTIRYYEEKGLIDPPARSEGGQRRYGAEGLRRLAFIKHARDLGLAMAEIRELIALSADPDRPCDEAHRIARAHRERVRRRIAALERLDAELGRIERACPAGAGGRVGECGVIDALGDHARCAHDHASSADERLGEP